MKSVLQNCSPGKKLLINSAIVMVNRSLTSLFLAFAAAFPFTAIQAQTTPVKQESDWPFIIIRHAHVVNECPEIFDKLLDIATKYPGGCDEVWLCGPSYATKKALQKAVPPLNMFRDKCDKYGIKLSFQQGVTVGHGVDPAFKNPRPDIYPFVETDFMCNERGERLYGQLCARSENVQKFAYEYTRTVLEVLNPDSYWLDDDLRIGVSKPNECFCDRCIAEFNEQNGTSYTRKELVSKIFGPATIEPVRGKWFVFNAETLAIYAAQSRKAADDLKSPCRLAYQSVWANTFYTGPSFKPLLAALSGPDKKSVGIRPGACHYTEDKPREMLHKSMSVAREAARCKRYGFIGQIAYEQENYTRKILHKSPEAIMIESTLAIASGCDSLSHYWYDSSNHEPLDYYDDFSHELSLWRPYFEMLAASTRRTRLAGLGRFLGANAYNHRSFDLDDQADELLAAYGIPVTVEEDEPDAYLVTVKSVECMRPEDFPKLLAKPVLFPADAFDKLLSAFPAEVAKYIFNAKQARTDLDKALANGQLISNIDGICTTFNVPADNALTPKLLQYGVSTIHTKSGLNVAIVQSFIQFPTAYRRRAILDALDKITSNAFPVRLDTCQAVRLLPHVDANGKVDSVTLINLSIGHTRELQLRVRHPKMRAPLIIRPNQASVKPACDYFEDTNENMLLIPPLPGWQPATVVFE